MNYFLLSVRAETLSIKDALNKINKAREKLAFHPRPYKFISWLTKMWIIGITLLSHLQVFHETIFSAFIVKKRAA